MMKRIGILILLASGMALACSGRWVQYQGVEIEPGVFQVLRSNNPAPPGYPNEFEVIGISRVSDFKTYLQNILVTNTLVFIASVDSVIEPGSTGVQDSGAFPIPTFTLAGGFVHPTTQYYLRIVVDTVLKGSLPSAKFWLKGYNYGTSCDGSWQYSRGFRFLNFSNKLDSVSDLKIYNGQSFCYGCPSAHSFDGQFLRSPNFPVLKIDIREILAGYPVAIRSSRLQMGKGPLRPNGPAYLPDGRVAPSNKGKLPLPALFKQMK